jgi:hypothetical protein
MEAVEIEKDFISSALSVELIGINSTVHTYTIYHLVNEAVH